HFRDQQASGGTKAGSTAKLDSGGGDVVDHSSEEPSHGSLPATSPWSRLCTKFQMKIRIEAEMMNEPMVDTSFSVVTPRLAGYVKTRRGMPNSPVQCIGMNVMFMPINIVQNVHLARRSFSRRPVNL